MPPPATLTEQLEKAVVAGEFTITEATTLELEESIATQLVVDAVGTPVRGAVIHAIVLVPGGVVDGKYRTSTGMAQFVVGESVFLFLSPQEDHYSVAFGFKDGVYRHVDDDGTAVTVDGLGQRIESIPCDGRPRLVKPARSEEGEQAQIGGGGLEWSAAVAALAACGGAP